MIRNIEIKNISVKHAKWYVCSVWDNFYKPEDILICHCMEGSFLYDKDLKQFFKVIMKV